MQMAESDARVAQSNQGNLNLTLCPALFQRSPDRCYFFPNNASTMATKK